MLYDVENRPVVKLENEKIHHWKTCNGSIFHILENNDLDFIHFGIQWKGSGFPVPFNSCKPYTHIHTYTYMEDFSVINTHTHTHTHTQEHSHRSADTSLGTHAEVQIQERKFVPLTKIIYLFAFSPRHKNEELIVETRERNGKKAQ